MAENPFLSTGFDFIRENVYFSIYVKISCLPKNFAGWDLCYSFSISLAINLPRTYAKLHCKREPYKFSGLWDPSVHTDRQTHRDSVTLALTWEYSLAVVPIFPTSRPFLAMTSTLLNVCVSYIYPAFHLQTVYRFNPLKVCCGGWVEGTLSYPLRFFLSDFFVCKR